MSRPRERASSRSLTTAADRRGEATLARHYGDAALDAERASTVPRPYALNLEATRCYLEGLIASSAGAWDDAAVAWLDAAEHFRRADQPVQAANCLGSAASAFCYGGRFADALPVATDARALAQATNTLTFHIVSLTALAMAVAGQDPARTRVLLGEAERDPAVDNYGEATQLTLTAASIGDWPLTARFATRSIPLLHWVNHRPMLHMVLTVVARALADTDPEAAATMQGAAHTLTATPATTTTATPRAEAPGATTPGGTPNRRGLIVETRRETTRLLVEVLGDQQLPLRDHGATMDTDTAVEYTLSRLDAFLTNTDD